MMLLTPRRISPDVIRELPNRFKAITGKTIVVCAEDLFLILAQFIIISFRFTVMLLSSLRGFISQLYPTTVGTF